MAVLARFGDVCDCWRCDKFKELEKEKCELLGIIQGKDNVIKDLEWQLQEVAKIKL